jgi:hypothetical protein
MPTGTDAPITSDLIERFNAIMADVLACVADAALRAAGVPWALRILLAPLVRRRIARYSHDFSALVADVRAGRLAAPAIGPDGALAVEQPHPDRRCSAIGATARVRLPQGRSGRTDDGNADDGTADGGPALESTRPDRGPLRGVVPDDVRRAVTYRRPPDLRRRRRTLRHSLLARRRAIPTVDPPGMSDFLRSTGTVGFTAS